MNILIHHRTQGKGVEAVHIGGIARGMEACGHAVRIVSPPGVGVSLDERKRGMVKMIALRSPQLVFECLELLHNLAALSRLAAAKRDFGCDLIYERYAFMGVAGPLAARAWRVPLALEVNYTAQSDLAVRKRSRAFSPVTRLCEDFAFRSAALLLPVSGKLAGDIEARGLPGCAVLVSPNAVDLARFRQGGPPPERMKRELFRHRPDIVIGFVGSFAPWHRVDMLIDASAEAAVQSDMKLGLMLIGAGGNRQDLESRASNIPGAVEVVFPGFVPHSGLPGYIASMDIAVMPHSNDYGSPMKVFEYMAMGKPVVAPDLGPLRDAVEHGIDGLLFRPGSREELARALLHLMRRPALRKEMGQRARLRVEREHNWQSRCAAILDRLADRSAMSGHGPAGPPLSIPIAKREEERPSRPDSAGSAAGGACGSPLASARDARGERGGGRG